MLRLVQEYASKTRLKDAWIALGMRRRAGDGVGGWLKARPDRLLYYRAQDSEGRFLKPLSREDIMG